VKVKRLVTVVTLIILLVGLILFDLTDLNISISDTSIPNNEVASTLNKTINYSESGVIMIARIIPSGEGGSNG
jgi:hypothetical protein